MDHRGAERGRGDAGASLVEYALLLALIAMVCIGAVTLLGNSTASELDEDAKLMFVDEP